MLSILNPYSIHPQTILKQFSISCSASLLSIPCYSTLHPSILSPPSVPLDTHPQCCSFIYPFIHLSIYPSTNRLPFIILPSVLHCHILHSWRTWLYSLSLPRVAASNLTVMIFVVLPSPTAVASIPVPPLPLQSYPWPLLQS